MPKGGARINSGPPPDPDALRRDRPADQAGWTTLPAVVHDAPPTFPLLGVSDRELELWAAVWSLPPAAMWHRDSAALEVALYVRALALTESGARGSATAAGEVRQWSDRLGLNPAAMLRLRWRVVADEVAERRGRPVGAVDMRDRVSAG